MPFHLALNPEGEGTWLLERGTQAAHLSFYWPSQMGQARELRGAPQSILLGYHPQESISLGKRRCAFCLYYH